MSAVRCSALVLLILLGGALALPAQAHTRSQSQSSWKALGDGAYQVYARVRTMDLTRAGLHPDTPAYPARAAAYISGHLVLADGDAPCPVNDVGARVDEGWVHASWRVRCGPEARLVLRSQLLEGTNAHLHMVNLTETDGQVQHKALVGTEREWPLGVQAYASGPGAALAFMAVGLEHIAGGWDHLAFLFGLLLLSRRVMELAVLVTGFTLGHSLTLAAAALGWLNPATATVEALIALSIALVAAEYALAQAPRRALPVGVAGALALMAIQPGLAVSSLSVAGMAVFAGAYLGLQQTNPAPQRLRVLVAVAFGLFHGFGFGGSLAQLHWPEAQTAWALLGFNLGVECGQVLVLALAWPLLRTVAGLRPAAPAAINALLAGAGSYWFVVRAFA